MIESLVQIGFLIFILSATIALLVLSICAWKLFKKEIDG